MYLLIVENQLSLYMVFQIVFVNLNNKWKGISICHSVGKRYCRKEKKKSLNWFQNQINERNNCFCFFTEKML